MCVIGKSIPSRDLFATWHDEKPACGCLINSYAILYLMKTGGQQPGGFTIIESMIFLAVSGALLLSALILVGGQQPRAQFNEAINEANSSIQDVLNDVSDGFVPINSDLSCTVNGTSLLFKKAGADAYGENTECMFIGKVLQTGVGSDQNLFNVYTIAGRRTNGSNDVASLDQALPTAITVQSPDIDQHPELDKTDHNSFKFGLKAYRLVGINGGSGVDLSSVGFIGSFAKSLGGVPTVNNAGIDLIGIAGTVSDNQTTVVSRIAGLKDSAAAAAAENNAAQGVVLCLSSFDGSFKASITIGGSGQRATTNLQVDNLAKECSS